MDSYLIAIRQALVLFPVLALFFTVPYVGYNYHKYGSILSLRILIVYSFMLYLLCVYCLVILPLPSPGEAAALRGHRAMQLIPFAFLGDIAEQSHVVWNQPGSWLTLVNNRAFLTTLFNLFMTLPFGMYLRYYFRCGWRKTLLLSFLLSLFFELTQLSGLYFIYPGAYRTFDVDDLIVNTAGSLLGYRLAHFVMRFLPSREEMDQRSFSRGRRVSALRRVMALLYDLLAGLLLCVVWMVLPLPEPEISWLWIYLAVWLAYVLFCQILLGGQTVGHRLTRLKVVNREGGVPRPGQYALRYGSLCLVMAAAPFLLNRGISALAAGGYLDVLAALTAYGLLDGGYLFLLLFELIRMAMHKPLFYERLSGTRLVSTVEY